MNNPTCAALNCRRKAAWYYVREPAPAIKTEPICICSAHHAVAHSKRWAAMANAE
jgi:hypothetical protein